MQTPDEIKTALKHCSTDDGCSADCPYSCCDVDSGALERDALAYIQRLEAELVAMRKALDRDGDLCRICKYNAAPHPESECDLGCMTCKDEHCACKKCLQSAATEGYEWDGGAT